MKLLLFLLLYGVAATAQTRIQVVDSLTGKPLPFATLECPEQGTGLYTDSAGKAVLPPTSGACPWQASFVGYQNKRFDAANGQTVLLVPKITAPVVVQACARAAYTTLTLRNKRRSPGFGFAPLRQPGFMWAAHVLNPAGRPVLLHDLWFGIRPHAGAGNPDAPLRIRIFAVDQSGMPGEELTNDDIMVVPGRFGWIDVTMRQYRIPVPEQGIIVAFEVFDAGPQYRQITSATDAAGGTEAANTVYGYQLEGYKGKDALGLLFVPGRGWFKQAPRPNSYAPAVAIRLQLCR